MRAHFLILTVLTLGLGLLGMSLMNEGNASNTSTESGALYIVTTTSQVGDVVRNVAGDQANVVSLMGPGVDPHLYRPTRSDMVKLKQADIIFYNGLHLEAQMDKVLGLLAQEKPVVSVASVLAKAEKLEDLEEKVYDPHIWMNVKNWIAVTSLVKNQLVAVKKDSGAYFEANAQRYTAQLKELNETITKAISSIPAQNRVLITAHDAFGYLGAAYGLDVVGIQGLSTESEAGLKHIEELVTRISDAGIPALFSETSVQDRNVNAVIAGVQNSGGDVRLGGHLYSDAMGTAGTFEGTYIGMMVHNTATITKALHGQADLFDGLYELASLNHAALAE